MKSKEFITENTQLKTVDVTKLQKEARRKVKEIFNQAFPIPIRTIARGGNRMQGLVFTFAPDEITQLANSAEQWADIAKQVESAFAQRGLKGKLQQNIWKNNGELRIKPKVLLTIDLIGKLEDLYFAVQDKEHLNPSAQLPADAKNTIDQVSNL